MSVDFPDDVEAYARQTSEIIRIHARSNGETGMSGDSENSETPASPGGAEAEDSGLAQLTAGRREAMRKRLEQLLSLSFDDLQGLHGRCRGCFLVYEYCSKVVVSVDIIIIIIIIIVTIIIIIIIISIFIINPPCVEDVIYEYCSEGLGGQDRELLTVLFEGMIFLARVRQMKVMIMVKSIQNGGDVVLVVVSVDIIIIVIIIIIISVEDVIYEYCSEGLGGQDRELLTVLFEGMIFLARVRQMKVMIMVKSIQNGGDVVLVVVSVDIIIIVIIIIIISPPRGDIPASSQGSGQRSRPSANATPKRKATSKTAALLAQTLSSPRTTPQSRGRHNLAQDMAETQLSERLSRQVTRASVAVDAAKGSGRGRGSQACSLRRRPPREDFVAESEISLLQLSAGLHYDVAHESPMQSRRSPRSSSSTSSRSPHSPGRCPWHGSGAAARSGVAPLYYEGRDLRFTSEAALSLEAAGFQVSAEFLPPRRLQGASTLHHADDIHWALAAPDSQAHPGNS
ncbi:hypothetical protein AK812_SmicGene31440 [Symbiodinium microadriaticum]|uniref:Uncharacterized protein n=1 Tax=Symbiodinium microadriaticum TaxID=2951 RepID=A0A1Q9CWU2_SYMMI|nr:hypothetical protein AK812_SmicGene31440 [Symbiodinium microadriaticum]